ncbi:MAG: YbjN domain-containing protein [Alphaproteobacteria bacterium]|nr:YbjN domain-containing protein [Alphaproteobacteria bacterium]
MSTLNQLTLETPENSLDVVEQTLLAADWACERAEDGVIHCAAMTRWGECAGMFAWRDEPASIHFSLSLDLRAPNARKAAIWDLLCKINERLWLGHFDYWADDGVAVFRHTIPMLDRLSPEPGEIAAIIAAGMDAADQFLPAFNFVVWAGKSPAEAIAAVLFETAGEA